MVDEMKYSKAEITRAICALTGTYSSGVRKFFHGLDEDIFSHLPDYESLPPFVITEIRWLRAFVEELLDRLEKSHPDSDVGLRGRYKAGPEGEV